MVVEKIRTYSSGFFAYLFFRLCTYPIEGCIPPLKRMENLAIQSRIEGGGVLVLSLPPSITNTPQIGIHQLFNIWPNLSVRNKDDVVIHTARLIISDTNRSLQWRCRPLHQPQRWSAFIAITMVREFKTSEHLCSAQIRKLPSSVPSSNYKRFYSLVIHPRSSRAAH